MGCQQELKNNCIYYVQISATVLCLLFFNSNIITWNAVKLLYSWIYLYHHPTELHYLWWHIYANSFSTSGDQGFPGNAVHKAELRSQMLLYKTLHARWNENDIHHFLKTVGFLQKYSDIKTPAPGFDFETCRVQPSVLPTRQPFKFP